MRPPRPLPRVVGDDPGVRNQGIGGFDSRTGCRVLPQVAHQTLFVVRVVSNDSLEGVPLDKVLKGIQAGDHVGSVIHLSHLRLEGTDDIDRALLALQAEDADLEVEPDLEDTHDAEQVEEREVQSDEDEDDGLFELPQQPATLNPVSAP